MRQLWFLISIGIFTVGLGGCGSPPKETAATPSPTSAAPTTSPATSPGASPQPTATPTPGKIPPFKDPLVKEQSNVAAGAGLIQSTNPEERLNLLGKRPTGTPVAPATTTTPSANVDPFAVLPPLVVQTTPDIGEAPEPPEQTTRSVPDLPKLPEAEPPLPWRNVRITLPTPRNQQVGGGRGLVPGGTSGNGNGLFPNPKGTAPNSGTAGPRRNIPALPSLPVAQVPDLPAIPNTEAPPAWLDPNPPPVAAGPLTPPPPSTDLAQAMEVTGVLQVGSQTKVILKAPAEPTSRYVNVGQRVSNGQVLVKRVKFDTGGEPIVIFEQNGVEIAKSVGAVNSPADQQMNQISLRSPSPKS